MELWKWLQKNHETWFWWEIHPHVGLLLLLLRCWVQELYSWSPPGVTLFMKFFHSFLFMWRMLKWPFIIYGKHVNVLDVFNLGLQLFLTMLQIVFSRPGNEAVLSCPSESFPSANWSTALTNRNIFILRFEHILRVGFTRALLNGEYIQWKSPKDSVT